MLRWTLGIVSGITGNWRIDTFGKCQDLFFGCTYLVLVASAASQGLALSEHLTRRIATTSDAIIVDLIQ